MKPNAFNIQRTSIKWWSGTLWNGAGMVFVTQPMVRDTRVIRQATACQIVDVGVGVGVGAVGVVCVC